VLCPSSSSQTNLSEVFFTYWASTALAAATSVVQSDGSVARRKGGAPAAPQPQPALIISASAPPPSAPLPAAGGSGDGSALGGPTCVNAPLPFPGVWAGLLLDWIAEGSEDTGVVFVGIEDIVVPITGVAATAQHWQQAAGCKDVWLVAVPPAQAPPVGRFMQPLLYTWAAPSSAPACDASNGSVVYANTSYLPADAAAQDGPLFAVPSQCNASGGDAPVRPGAQSTQVRPVRACPTRGSVEGPD
jgi:hypothetical protein